VVSLCKTIHCQRIKEHDCPLAHIGPLRGSSIQTNVPGTWVTDISALGWDEFATGHQVAMTLVCFSENTLFLCVTSEGQAMKKTVLAAVVA
jgi:hypothetical protein